MGTSVWFVDGVSEWQIADIKVSGRLLALCDVTVDGEASRIVEYRDDGSGPDFGMDVEGPEGPAEWVSLDGKADVLVREGGGVAGAAWTCRPPLCISVTALSATSSSAGAASVLDLLEKSK
jgi:hypothetical protein